MRVEYFCGLKPIRISRPQIGGAGSLALSTRIKDAGIAIRHSRGRILFYTAGSRNGLKGVRTGGRGHTKEVVPETTMLLYTAGSRDGLEGVGGRGYAHTKRS